MADFLATHYDAQGRVDWQKDAAGLVSGQQTAYTYVTNGDGTHTTTVAYPAASNEPTWTPKDASGVAFRLPRKSTRVRDETPRHRWLPASDRERGT